MLRQEANKISLVGIPGAGKTTLCQLLATSHGYKHVSSGNLIRQFLTDEHTKSELAKGHFAPNEEAVRRLMREAIEGVNMYVLDGFPRSADQIDTLGIKIEMVLYLDTPPEIAKQRLLGRGRTDDTLDVINERMSIQTDTVAKVLERLTELNIPIERVNGDQTYSMVLSSAIQALLKYEVTDPDQEATTY